MVTSNSSGNGSYSTGKNNNAVTAPWDDFDSGLTAWVDFSSVEQEKIVKHFAPKVKYLALRLKARLPKSVEMSELISAGTLGLMEAFGKFKPELGIKFDTYAENRIRGAMLDELRRLDWFPRSLRRRVKILDEAISKLEHDLGESPSVEALVSATGMTEKEVREGLEALQSQVCLSLDMLTESYASLVDTRVDEPSEKAAFSQLIEKVAGVVEQLTPREKLVLSLYYTEELNMREAAEIIGITEGRVSQLHSQALSRLRKELSSRYGEITI